MKRILVIGKSGFLASHLKYQGTDERFYPDNKQISNFLDSQKPDVVVNCLGYAGVKNIDDCENNKEKTVTSNLLIPTIFAQESQKRDIHFIHIGSGCLFYGESPNISVSLAGPKETGWIETDNPKLQKSSFYSKIKYACDLAIGSLPNTLIARIRMPLSPKKHPRNLISKLLRYKDLVETPNSVTFLDDLVRMIDWSIEQQKTGIYHVVSSEALLHSQILDEYKKYHPEHEYKKITEEELDKLVTAPRSNCILSNKKLVSEGFKMSPTLDTLKLCIEKYVKESI